MSPTALRATRARSTRARRRPARAEWGSVRHYLVLAGLAVFTTFPFYAMLVLAFREPGPIVFPDALFPTSLSAESLRAVLTYNSLPKWALNTAIYSVVSVVGVIGLASLAAYAFAKMRFRGQEVLFWIVLGSLLIPYHVALIPQFILVSQMGMADTLSGLIIPGLANTQALFLLRQFIRQIPDELIEAATIDGASEFRIYWSIILPLTRPILATLGVFVFLWNWNDFLWPLVITNSDAARTLTVGMASLQEQEVSVTVVMAGALLTLLPALIVFLVLQRYFVQGVTSSGLKG